MSWLLRIYYALRPLIPRRLQIAVRRVRAKRVQAKSAGYWPINSWSHVGDPLPHPWPDGKRFALVLVHDVETQHGYLKCEQLMELDRRFGFRSSFNFVPHRYQVDTGKVRRLQEAGFEVGVHGLKHDGKLFSSPAVFSARAKIINSILKEWGAVGFYSPSMHYDRELMHELDILYDQSTFDTDPFEPLPSVEGPNLPFVVASSLRPTNYIELPYTLAQDHTLFIIMQETSIEVWRQKLDWIVEHGGMALIKTHPDYMDFSQTAKSTSSHYPASLYEELLEYVGTRYAGQYWHVLPKELAAYWQSTRGPDANRQ